MQLFYNASLSQTSGSILFDKDESRHIFKVLRYKSGDALYVTNGQGLLVKAILNVVDPKKTVAEIISSENVAPLPYRLHLVVAPTKLNDRYEWFLEKATEIGVSEITPIICDNSERKVVKIERLNKIVQSAMKQSLQFTLPKLNDPIKFSEFINQKFTEEIFIAHCEKDIERRFLKNIATKNSKYTILVGPEGDFSAKEIDKSLTSSFIPISLGENRLRTETAGLNIAQSIAFIHQ